MVVGISKEKYFGDKKDGGLGYRRDEVEVQFMQLMEMDWPKPGKAQPFTRRVVLESFQKSIEVCYFWSLNHWRYDQHMPIIEKITDTFAASEHSAFFGVQQQRLGIQQDKVSQFLATIGKMVKELFQIVRELRVIDERMGYYEDSYSENNKVAGPADITLKGIYIDLVEGGSKNPASIYGMAAQLQFTTLPDLFFNIHPKTSKQVGEMIEKLDFNKKVKEVLQRKLYSFLRWKEETFHELKSRRTFTLKYLRQHFAAIRLYITWAKPYLKNVARLSTAEGKTETPDLVSAFEGSMVDIEVMAYMKPEGNKKYYGVALQTFEYRTRPSLSYQQEGYQRGPIHVGETKVYWRSYAWTKEDMENYKAMRAHEDYELLAYIDDSVKSAMDALGADLEKYLEEAGERYPTGDVSPELKKDREGKQKKKKPGVFDPFTSAFKGWGDMIPKSGKSKQQERVDAKEIANAHAAMKGKMYNHWKNFKKNFKFFHW